MVEISAKIDIDVQPKSALEKDLVNLQKELQGALDKTSKLKMTGVDPNMEVIDREKAEKHRQETMGKLINNYLKAKKNSDPADEYLKKIKKKEKIDFEFDISAFLNATKKAEPLKPEEPERKNEENADFSLGGILKGKLSNPQAAETDEIQIIGASQDKKADESKEKEDGSGNEGKEGGLSLFGLRIPLFSQNAEKKPAEQQESQQETQPLRLFLGESNEQANKNEAERKTEPVMPGIKLPADLDRPRQTTPLTLGMERGLREPPKTEVKEEPKHDESKIPTKIALAMLKNSLREGYFEQAPVHVPPKKVRQHGYNPFEDSDTEIHPDLPEDDGEKYWNPFKNRAERKPTKPVITVEYYEEEDDEDFVRSDEAHAYPLYKSVNHLPPVFGNPFHSPSKNHEPALKFKKERDGPVFEEDNFVFGQPSHNFQHHGQHIHPEGHKQKRRGEREVRSGYDQDDPYNHSNGMKDKEIPAKNEGFGLKKLKDWMGHHFGDDQDHDSQHQKYPSQRVGESGREHDKKGSWMRMKGMDTTNSDLDTLQRSNQAFDWALPENVDPLLMPRKYEQTPMIIEEEQERNTHQQTNSQHGSQVLNVKNKLPGWYGQDPETGLYENMYLVDAVRYNNFKAIHHDDNPERSTIRSRGRSSANANERDRRYESPPNLSKKLEPSRPSQKSDKRIAKVICFVTKYHGGDIEDDDDRDDFGQREVADLKKSHHSPYLEVPHQNAFRPGSSNPLKNSGYGIRQPMANAAEDDGYFDVDKYKQNKQKWAMNYLSDAGEEEDEGVRQTVRASVRLSQKRF